jgi:hypothetical protein
VKSLIFQGIIESDLSQTVSICPRFAPLLIAVQELNENGNSALSESSLNRMAANKPLLPAGFKHAQFA